MDIEQVAEQLGTQSEDIPDVLSTLALEAYERYEESNSENDIDMAVRLANEAIRKTCEGDPSLSGRFNNLGVMLESRYERTGALPDLEEAIEVARQAITLTPTDDHSDRANRLNNLGNMLESRYEETGTLPDLEEALEVAKHALPLIPMDHPDRPTLLSNLGNKFETRYKRTGEMADLEEAIRTTKQAIQFTSEDHPDYATWLNNLGAKLSRRYERTGEITDLDEAIHAARQAIKSTPPYHPDQVTWANNLGNRLIQRYERMGNTSDLDEGIQMARQAAELIPTGHPERIICLNNLGNAFGYRYERTGEIADLEEAIQAARQAVKSTPAHHHDRPTWLNNLGNKLEKWYERTSSIPELEEAITIAREAIELTPMDHPYYPSWLISLGDKLERWYERTDAILDLEEAITVARQAIELTPTGHYDLGRLLNNLGSKLEVRYERTANMTDLDEAIQIARQATDSTQADDPNQATFLKALGDTLEKRYKRIGEIADLEEATNSFYNAWNCRTAVPFPRVGAAARCLKLLTIQEKFDIATQLGKDAIDLLPNVHTNLLDRNDKQFAVSIFVGIAADLCAALLASDQIETALQYLERGRDVIIGQLLDYRSDISDLEGTYPEIAHRYQSLVDEVNSPLRGIKHDTTGTQFRERRRESMDQLDACIREIRSIKGHERFLLGQTTAEMRECATDGSIVVVNITEFRSDVIIVSRTAIRKVGLSNLSAADMKAWSSEESIRQSRRPPESTVNQYRPWSLARCASRDAKLAGSARKENKFRGFLARLWSDCVRLVLEELGFYKNASTQELPRIWWIGTGLASSLPFHAAGDHSVESTENTLSWAISSYTPSIKALRHAREKTRAGVDKHSLLLVTMPKTPGKDDLPGVKVEEKAICDVVQAPHSIELLDRPGKDIVLEKLGDFSIVHFACHGSSDLVNPSNSFLALQGNSESVPEKLTVQEILDANLGRAWLAYLSACSTAQNKVSELADEDLHLASSFQVAGFGHVIASMWPSSDTICAHVARLFYQDLMTKSEGKGDNRAVAEALHKAVKEICLQNIERPYLWAQYIHSGA